MAQPRRRARRQIERRDARERKSPHAAEGRHGRMIRPYGKTCRLDSLQYAPVGRTRIERRRALHAHCRVFGKARFQQTIKTRRVEFAEREGVRVREINYRGVKFLTV